MENTELIKALREDAEWTHAYELGFDFVAVSLTRITLPQRKSVLRAIPRRQACYGLL